MKDWRESRPNDFHIGKTKRLVGLLYSKEKLRIISEDTEAKFKVSSKSIEKAVGQMLLRLSFHYPVLTNI